jgi:hypothetical protein
MAHDVFISYSTKDKIIADAVCAKLEESKIRAWIAPRDVPGGSNFAASIIRAINTCKVFVLIWSANTNTSNHILNEINQAFDQGIIILPFRIQDVQPTDEMRYYLGRTHWLDAIDPPLENHIENLIDTILINLGRERQPAAPAPMSQEIPTEVVEPPVMPGVEKETAIEKAEDVRSPDRPSRQKKKEAEASTSQRPEALPANITRFIPYAAGGLAVITLIVLYVSGVFKGSAPAVTAQSSPSPAVSIMPTSTMMPTATSIPITPTNTVSPTATSTPIPAWMEDINTFAESILEAIPRHSPRVWFDDSPITWIKQEDWSASIEYVDGEIVASDGFSWTMWYTDFVIEMDYRILSPSEGRWSFYARGGHQVGITFSDDGRVYTEKFLFPDAAKPGGSVNHVLIIVQDAVALFVNDQPIYYEDLPEGWKNGEATWWVNDSTVAFDNIRIWNLNDIQTLP